MPEIDGDGELHARLTRRAAIRLGASAGGAFAVAPFVARASTALGVDNPGVYDLGAITPAATPRLNWPVPPMVTRAQWGADERLRHDGREYDTKVEKLIVHHTATPNGASDWSKVLRGIYGYSVSSGGYLDLPYHWMIDPHGRIYEGRYARTYPAGTPHSGENSSRQNVRGGHALNHNSRTIGIAFMGTYTNAAPPAAAINALITVLAWKCARWGIDPTGATPYKSGTGATETLPNIIGHRDVRATTCPGVPMESLLPSVRAEVKNRMRGGSRGYWIASADGRAMAFGDVPDQGDTRRMGISRYIVGIAGHKNGLGYWLASADGAVYPFGSARNHGSMAGRGLSAPVVGIAAHPSGNGYWLVGGDGGIFTFGAAQFYGSTGAKRLTRPVVGLCPTPSGRGYWLFASDGGIFSFGDAKFRGSTGGMRLNQPIVAMAPTKTGKGYWLFARDGGVFSFGDAKFYGSGAARHLPSPVVDAAASSTGKGYALLMRNGGIATFGDAPSFGSGVGRTTAAVGLDGKLVPKK